MKVYLAGGGGMGVDYAEQWRSYASKYFDAIDPFRANKLRTAYDQGSYQGEKYFTPNEIVLRDLSDIRRCDAVLAEMRCDAYNYIGTSSEIFFANSIGKPVILWTTKKYANHPWLVHACVKIFTGTLDEACNYIAEQWGD